MNANRSTRCRGPICATGRLNGALRRSRGARLTCAPFLLLWLVLGCVAPDLNTFATENTTPEEREFAESYLRLLSSGVLDSAAALLAPNLRTDTAAQGLQVVSTLLHDARLDSLHLIGVNVNSSAGTQAHDVNLSYEVPTTGGRWLTTNVATARHRVRLR
jgi:hypothetical protein